MPAPDNRVLAVAALEARLQDAQLSQNARIELMLQLIEQYRLLLSELEPFA